MVPVDEETNVFAKNSANFEFMVQSNGTDVNMNLKSESQRVLLLCFVM